MALRPKSILVRQVTRYIPCLRNTSIRAAITSSNVSSSVCIENRSLNLRAMATLSAGSALKNLAKESPHVDVIRYEHKNVKWTLNHVNHFADALATGFIDSGLKPGDVVLSWLPLHFAEQVRFYFCTGVCLFFKSNFSLWHHFKLARMVSAALKLLEYWQKSETLYMLCSLLFRSTQHILQFACSKAGFILYHLDPSQAIKDSEGSKNALAKALELTEANVLITQEAGNDVNYVRLVEGVIPETRIFNVGDGMPFFTPRYPHLRFPIHTGFDYTDKPGMIPLQQILCPTGELSNILAHHKIDGETPLMGELITGSDGVPTEKGKVLSNQEVVDGNHWPEFCSILKKEYKEIQGVGVVF